MDFLEVNWIFWCDTGPPNHTSQIKLNVLKSCCHAYRHMYTGNIYKTIWLYIKTDFYNNRTKDFTRHSKGFAPADSKMPYLGGRREVEWDWGWVWVGSGKGVCLTYKTNPPSPTSTLPTSGSTINKWHQAMFLFPITCPLCPSSSWLGLIPVNGRPWETWLDLRKWGRQRM